MQDSHDTLCNSANFTNKIVNFNFSTECSGITRISSGISGIVPESPEFQEFPEFSGMVPESPECVPEFPEWTKKILATYDIANAYGSIDNTTQIVRDCSNKSACTRRDKETDSQLL